MRVFKKGRAQRNVFSWLMGPLSTGLDWKARDVLVSLDHSLKWLIPDGEVEKKSEEEIANNARESINLKDCTVDDKVVEEPLPSEVKRYFKGAALRFFTFEIHQMGVDTPLKLGFVDKDMLDNLRDQIVHEIEHIDFKHPKLDGTSPLASS